MTNNVEIDDGGYIYIVEQPRRHGHPADTGCARQLADKRSVCPDLGNNNAGKCEAGHCITTGIAAHVSPGNREARRTCAEPRFVRERTHPVELDAPPRLVLCMDF